MAAVDFKSLESIREIGPKRAQVLAKAGIFSRHQLEQLTPQEVQVRTSQLATHIVRFYGGGLAADCRVADGL